MITVEVPVDCGGADHRVVLKIDAAARIRCHLEDHDQRAEDVLESLGAPPSTCGTVRRAATTLRSSIPYAIERALWLRIGVRDARDLLTWHEAGVRNPSIAERWLSFTDRSLVAEWRIRGFRTPAQAAPWGLAGFGPGEAHGWVRVGKTINEAIGWSSRGVASATSAIGWNRLGVLSPEDVDPWVRAGVRSGSDAEVWARLDVRCPTDVGQWLRAGAIDAVDAVEWRRAGVNLEAAESQLLSWRRVGVSRGRDAAAWTAAGACCGDLMKWRAHGVGSGKELVLWRALGVQCREDLAAWQAIGVEDGKTAKAWVTAGVRDPADLAAWHAAGVRDAREAVAWVWPHFVFSTAEVAKWKAAGLTDPAIARRRVDSLTIPASVIETRNDGILALRYRGGSGRPGEVGPARPGACPTAVVTERYFYCLWHYCHPDVATDVIEVDFDVDGKEVSRCTRPLARTDRTVTAHCEHGTQGAGLVTPPEGRSKVSGGSRGLARHVFCPSCGGDGGGIIA